ncbi:MAG: hypothetical protein H0X33_06800 [Taibaiella sp.]|nr:hypothetical protein [Taibaiella sp.]
MYLLYWIIAFGLSAGAGYWIYKADKKRSVPYPWLTALLRSLVVLATLLLLLAPAITINKNEIQKPVILFLQDNSRSIADALGKDSVTYRTNAQALLKKLSDKYKVVQWGFGAAVQQDSVFTYIQPATDIAGALAAAQDFYGAHNLSAVILASDGRYNQGTNPLYQQANLHGNLYSVAIGDSATPKDIRIAKVYANKMVSVNSTFEIRADIIATKCKGYNNAVKVYEGGSMMNTAPIPINTDRYDRTVSFTVKAEKAGLHHYIISVPPADDEANTANNRQDIFVEVVGEKKNILIVCAAPHPDVTAITEALSGIEAYKVTVKTADEMPVAINDYQIIILHQVPSHLTGFAKDLRKPVWMILGPQSDLQAVNELQHFLKVQPVPLHDVLAGYNTSFTSFTVPQNIQAIMDKMPPLQSAVSGTVSMPGASVLFKERNSDGPLWTLQQGQVPMAILAGEGIWRWRLYEYKNFGKHEVVDEYIRQTVAFLAAYNNEQPFRAEVPKYIWSDQERISINAYLLNANNEQVNTPDAQLTISDSMGRKHAFSFERSGTAYRLNIGIWAGGTYTYAAHTVYNGKACNATGSFVVRDQPLEMMETGADYPLMYGIAKKYNGAMVPAGNISSLYDSITHNRDIKPLIQTTTETIPLVDWKWYFFLILLLATGEWLLRKYWLAQ